MKITASAAELGGALALAALALDDKIKIEIFHAAHIQAADGSARFTVNGRGRVIATSATAEIIEPGETAVRAAALAGLASGFAKDGTIAIEADARGAKIRCGRATYRLPVLPLEQLPATPTIDSAMGEVELARADLLGAIRQVMFAASTEATRHHLNGVCPCDEGGRLAAIATDGHRLAKCLIPAGPFAQDLTCIVPLATIEPVVKLLGKSKADRVKLRHSGSLIEIAAPGFALTSKLIDGTFPDYRRLIPASPENSATIHRADLAAALKRLAAVAADERKIADLVGLEWNPAESALRLSLPNQAGTAEDIIAATIAGSAPVRTAAQLTHVTELAGELTGERICIAAGNARDPILVIDDATLILQAPCALPARSAQQAA